VEQDFDNSANLHQSYRVMANDEQREREAEEWVEGLIGDAFTQRFTSRHTRT